MLGSKPRYARFEPIHIFGRTGQMAEKMIMYLASHLALKSFSRSLLIPELWLARRREPTLHLTDGVWQAVLGHNQIMKKLVRL